MTAETNRIDVLFDAARSVTGRPGPRVVTVAIPPLIHRLAYSRDAHLALILVAELVSISAMTRAATGWSWLVSCEVATLLTLGFWLPLRQLIIQPMRRDARATKIRLQADETMTAERAEMMGIIEESEARLRAIFNNSPNGIVVLDGDSRCPIDFNDTMPRLFGYSRDEFVSLPLDRYVIDDNEATVQASIDRAVRGALEHFTCACRTRTGGTFDASFTAQVVTANGQPAVSCIVRDITPEREAERALRVTHERMAAMISELERRKLERTVLTEMGGVLQACISLDEAFSAVSRFGQRLFPSASGALYVYSHSRSDLELSASWNLPVGGFDDVMVPNDCWGLRQGHAYDRTDGSHLPCRHVNDDGTVPYLCVPLTAQGETVGVLHLRAPDAATGSPARLEVNRSLVATVCDQITLGIANLRLRDTLRVTAEKNARSCCRIRRKRAPSGVEAIRARVAELRVEHRGRSLGGLTVSLGIAMLPDHGTTQDDLLRAADKALYRAKQLGCDQAQLAIPEAPLTT